MVFFYNYKLPVIFYNQTHRQYRPVCYSPLNLYVLLLPGTQGEGLKGYI